MFIDSPQFSHRKIINDPRNDTHTRQPNNLPYQYGVQRSQLARHVTKSLNSHQTDFEILQRFRREAEADKHRKWMAKRAPSKVEEEPQKPARKQSPPPSFEEVAVNPEIKQVVSVVKEDPHQYSPSRITYVTAQGQNDKDMLARELERLLWQKDKQLRKKDRKLERSKITIEQMAHKIEKLKLDKREALLDEEREFDRLKHMMGQMNMKIVENQAVFRQQMAKLRLKMIPMPEPYRKQHSLSPPMRRKSHVMPRNYDSQRFLNGPSVFYQVESKGDILPSQSVVSHNIPNEYENKSWLQENASRSKQYV